MSKPWLDIIGIGEDGEVGLSPVTLQILNEAEIIIGGDRHHKLTSNKTAERLSWPSPFDAMIERIRAERGKRIAVLVTGDPLWYSVGARINRAIATDEIRFHPQLSAFQLAACRLGWSIPDVETVTIHGRAASQILPRLAPDVRLLVLTKDASSPGVVAKLLNERGFGQSRLTVLAAMGGDNEKRFDGIAHDWSHEVPAFHVLAIECVAAADAQWYPRTGGLPDDAFEHDGQLTKQEVRAVTIARLAPYRDALLWDIGAGCGSVSIEWMRSATGAMVIALEPVEKRRAMIANNAVSLGTEKLQIIEGRAPEGLAGLPQPDAIFIGGGVTGDGVAETCFEALRQGGRLVANVVTLESESKLHSLQQTYGGDMSRIFVSRAKPVGRFHSWKPAMTVTQWVVVKPMELKS